MIKTASPAKEMRFLGEPMATSITMYTSRAATTANFNNLKRENQPLTKQIIERLGLKVQYAIENLPPGPGSAVGWALNL